MLDKPLAKDIDVRAIARGTPGFNGAGMLCLFCFVFFNHSVPSGSLQLIFGLEFEAECQDDSLVFFY